MLVTIYVQVPRHYWEVLWRDGHMGDRRGDAHQSQLAQLRVSPAEERHPHEQLSRDAKWQLSEEEIVRGSYLRPLWGTVQYKSQSCGEQRTEGMPGFGAALFELLLAAKSSLFLIGGCSWSFTHLGRVGKTETLYLNLSWSTDRGLSLQSKSTLCMMWTCLGSCF